MKVFAITIDGDLNPTLVLAHDVAEAISKLRDGVPSGSQILHVTTLESKRVIL